MVAYTPSPSPSAGGPQGLRAVLHTGPGPLAAGRTVIGAVKQFKSIFLTRKKKDDEEEGQTTSLRESEWVRRGTLLVKPSANSRGPGCRHLESDK